MRVILYRTLKKKNIARASFILEQTSIVYFLSPKHVLSHTIIFKERSISKSLFLIFLHLRIRTIFDIGHAHRTTSPFRLSMSPCPSKINEHLLILVVRTTSLQPRVDFFSSQIAHQVVHKLLANDNNNTRNREPRL